MPEALDQLQPLVKKLLRVRNICLPWAVTFPRFGVKCQLSCKVSICHYLWKASNDLNLTRASKDKRGAFWIKGRDVAAACLLENPNVLPSLHLEEDTREWGPPGRRGALGLGLRRPLWLSHCHSEPTWETGNSPDSLDPRQIMTCPAIWQANGLFLVHIASGP